MKINDYIFWRGDLSFEQDRINGVDAGILADITYIDFKNFVPSFPSKKGIKFSKCASSYFEANPPKKIIMGLILPHEIIDLAMQCYTTKRFGSIKISNYSSIINLETSEQFAAYTFILNKDEILVSYRGTDDSLVGWQENVDMLFKFPYPGQIDAAKYLNQIASIYPHHKIYVTGHSKGGNLAMYAGLYCDDKIKDRIVMVYNNDGPGFRKNLIDKNKLSMMKGKIISFLPQDSVFGMVFDTISTVKVVSAKAKGAYQHNFLTWEVDGPKFLELPSVTKKSMEIDKRITKMIDELTVEDSKVFAQDIYNFYTTVKLQNLIDIKSNMKLANVVKGIKTINKKDRKLIITLALVLVQNGAI